MLKYRGSQLARAGFIGVVLIILVIAVGLQPERLLSWATAIRYQALFAEAGGLAVGNDVTVSGIKVGSISSIKLDNGDALVGFTIDGKYAVGSDTTAHIRTGTLLGERVLVLDPQGSGTLDPLQPIPTSRTSSPYSLTDAVSELTSNTANTDTDSLNQSLDTLSATLDQIAPQLGPTFDGLSRLSQSLNSRNDSLAELLRTAGDVTGIFSERSRQVNALILNANDLLAVLNERRYAITSLLANVSAVSQHLSGLVADNEGSNFSNPVWFVCGLIGGVANTTAPETAKLCAQYLGPALRAVPIHNIPFPINQYLRPAVSPDRLIYTDPKLAPGGAGPGDPPENLPTVSAYVGSGDIPPPPGWGAPPGPLGIYQPDFDAPATPSPALFPGAPIPGPPNILSNIPAQPQPQTVDGLLLPPTPAPAPAPAVAPNAPLLPAEGMPPA